MALFTHEYWMQQAIRLASHAYDQKEVPVGAIVVKDDQVIGKGYNQVMQLGDATAHAEMIAITAASDFLASRYLNQATLYVTKEPCLMCAGAILNARVKTVVFGALDTREGAAGSHYDCMREYPKWFVEIIPGICRENSESLLQDFFAGLRNEKKEDG